MIPHNSIQSFCRSDYRLPLVHLFKRPYLTEENKTISNQYGVTLDGTVIYAKEDHPSSSVIGTTSNHPAYGACYRCLVILGDLGTSKTEVNLPTSINLPCSTISKRYWGRRGLGGRGCEILSPSRTSMADQWIGTQSGKLYLPNIISDIFFLINYPVQLAVVATYTNDDLEAAYRYVRAIDTDMPFSTARDNLLVLYQKIQQSFDWGILPPTSLITKFLILQSSPLSQVYV